MKTYLLFAFIFLTALSARGQYVPGSFSFQGVARDATGKVIVDKPIQIKITIHKDSPSGPIANNQQHSVQTNSLGIFTIAINQTLNAGFDWKYGPFFLQIELDPDNGFNFIDLGATELLSVPYSRVAEESFSAKNWTDNYPVVQKGSSGVGSLTGINIGNGPRLIWHPSKGVFRVGGIDGNLWNDENTMGEYSFAAGFNTQGSGNHSIALGSNILAKCKGCTAIGTFNDISDAALGTTPGFTDRIFQVGNGSGSNDRKNALTILRNGNTGLGGNVLDPEYLFDLGGRARIRHAKNQTAGIYFNTSANVPDGFVGMKLDDQIGFYLNGWRFWVNDQGNGYINGNLVQTSDRRLKTNISNINHSLGKIAGLQARHYNWKDASRDQSLQTGLIAQDVEKIFPDLVTTDKDGYKAVNYIGLIPHLIEAVKDLKDQNAEIAALRQQVAQLSEITKKFQAMENNLRKDLNTKTQIESK
jgi:hypothetical protein